MNHTVRQYVQELEQQNPLEEPVHEQDQVSTTDPDSTYATKGGTPARLGYYDNYLVDNQSCVIVGVQATAARMSQETVAAQDMIGRTASRPETGLLIPSVYNSYFRIGQAQLKQSSEWAYGSIASRPRPPARIDL